MENSIHEEVEQSNCSTQNNDLPFSRPLYNGSLPDLTEYMANLLIFQYAVKHSLTEKAVDQLLHLLRTFLPKDALIPKSLKQIKKFFMDVYTSLHPVTQKYCSNCHALLGSEDLCSCSAGCGQFISVPIGPQLKARLEGTVIIALATYPQAVKQAKSPDRSNFQP